MNAKPIFDWNRDSKHLCWYKSSFFLHLSEVLNWTLCSLLLDSQRFRRGKRARVNVAKSSQWRQIRCRDIDMDHTLQGFTGSRVNFPLYYLGLPPHNWEATTSSLSTIQDKAKAKLASWKANWLSPGRRRILVAHVLSVRYVLATQY